MKRYNIQADFDDFPNLNAYEESDGDWVKYEDAKVLEDLLNEWLSWEYRFNKCATPGICDLVERTTEALKK